MSDVYLFIISPSIFGLIIIYPSNLCLCLFILHVVILTSTTVECVYRRDNPCVSNGANKKEYMSPMEQRITVDKIVYL